jgi:hypothetical protein
VSNIVLEDFTLGVLDTSFPGFGIALFASDSAFVRGVEITTHSNHWAVAVLGNRTVFDQIKIRNTGYIYRDGIHFLGGRGLTVTSSDIDTGDDCVAISSASALDVEIADVTVTGNHLVSSHAHAIRINQENPSPTKNKPPVCCALLRSWFLGHCPLVHEFHRSIDQRRVLGPYLSSVHPVCSAAFLSPHFGQHRQFV